jgi:hypothetical protein
VEAHDAWGVRRRACPLILGADARPFEPVALSTSNKLQSRREAPRLEAYKASLRGIRIQRHRSRGAPHSADTESACLTSMVLESEARPRFSGCRHSHPQDNSNIATLRPDLACRRRVHASGRHPELADVYTGGWQRGAGRGCYGSS